MAKELCIVGHSDWSFVSVAAAAAKSLQSCLTLCGPIDGSPPGSPVPGIFQARPLEWVAISFSNAGKWKVKGKWLSRVWLFATPWTAVHQAPPPMGFVRLENLSLSFLRTFSSRQQGMYSWTFCWVLNLLISRPEALDMALSSQSLVADGLFWTPLSLEEVADCSYQNWYVQ